ncbi:MAG: LemA family protein [Mucinivorans sp.]
MKKYIKWGIIVALVVILVSFFAGTYNSLVDKRMEAERSWSNVESQFQRRADLIPNLVSTVKGYASHEQLTFIQVVEQRAKATQPQIKFEDLNDQTLAKYQASQNEVGAALGRLMAIGESYPDLKASTNFINLQDELAGTENRVNKARIDFHTAIKDYNVYLQKFPRNIVASMFSFTQKSFFEADSGAEKAPEVKF